jgi:hypothetical protein
MNQIETHRSHASAEGNLTGRAVYTERSGGDFQPLSACSSEMGENREK